MKRTGRPPLDDEPAKVVIRLRVTQAQRLKLRRVADENGTGMSGIIREAVSEFCSDYREHGSPFGGNKTKRRVQTVGMAQTEPMSTQNTPTGQPGTPTTPAPQPSTPTPPSTPGTTTDRPSSTPSTPDRTPAR